MSLQPKNRKYRLSFRNKTQIYNNLPKDIRIRKLKNNLYYKTNGVFKELAHHEKIKLFLKSAQSPKPNLEFSINMNSRVSQITIVKKSKSHETFCYQTAVFKNPLFKPKIETSYKLNNKQLEPILLPLQKSLATNLTSAVIDKIKFGSCGFYFCSSGTISSKFIETIRLIIARKLKKLGRFWIRVSPDTPVTARSAETRMGRGKGAISHYEAKIRPGQMFIEFSGVPQESVRQIFQQIAKKTAVPIDLIY